MRRICHRNRTKLHSICLWSASTHETMGNFTYFSLRPDELDGALLPAGRVQNLLVKTEWHGRRKLQCDWRWSIKMRFIRSIYFYSSATRLGWSAVAHIPSDSVWSSTRDLIIMMLIGPVAPKSMPFDSRHRWKERHIDACYEEGKFVRATDQHCSMSLGKLSESRTIINRLF